MLNTARRGRLPDIQILYLGQTYEYSLPWHNAWVLIAITVPAGDPRWRRSCGLVYALRHAGRDRLPLFFLLNLATLPALRMLADAGARRGPPVPAHVLLPGRPGGLGLGRARRRAGARWSAARTPWRRAAVAGARARLGRPGNSSRSTRSSSRITTS